MNRRDTAVETKRGPEAERFESYKSRLGEELDVSNWLVFPRAPTN